MRRSLARRPGLAPTGLLAEARRLARERSLHAAVHCYAGLLTSHTVSASVWLEYGLVLLELEYHQRALAAFDAALAQDTRLARAWNERGVALAGLSRSDEARDAFETARQLDPQLCSAASNLATWHLNRGDAEQASRLFRRALAVAPDHLAARIGLGRALTQCGQHEKASSELTRALLENPSSWDALLALTVFHTTSGALAEARRVTREFVSTSPAHSGAIGLDAELSRELGDSASGELLDSELWLSVEDLEIDSGRQRELCELLLAHHSLSDSPPHHATQAGRHSGALFGTEEPLLAEVESRIASALSGYYRRAVREPHRAALLASPGPVALNGWGIALDGKGYQLPHLHPAAWLSGVFYVAVPELPSATSAHEGCLQLGPIDPALGLTAARPPRYVAPRPGRLVIFPSWLYHSTVPHRVPGVRVSLAFDCVRLRTSC